MTSRILLTIRHWLQSEQVAFRELHHEPTATSVDSARVRGEPLGVGGKALLIKTDGEFRIFVLPAHRRFDSRSARTALGFRKSRFASPDELYQLTGLVPGSLPPFGDPIFPFPLHVDPSLAENDRIAFNAGSLTDSMILAMDDYLRIARPTLVSFSVPVESPK